MPCQYVQVSKGSGSHTHTPSSGSGSSALHWAGTGHRRKACSPPPGLSPAPRCERRQQASADSRRRQDRGGRQPGEGLQQSLRNRGEEAPPISSPRHCSFSGRTSRPGLVHRSGPAARHVTIMHLASTSTPKEISKYNPDCGALFR